MAKAGWVKQHGRSDKGIAVDWTDDGKNAIEAVWFIISELGPQNLNPQLWWAVGTLTVAF
jgi:hypothetical protein